MEINGRQIGGNNPCYIVAEAGVAHFGDIEKALRLVDLAVGGGADAVKFQTYKTENFINPKSKDLFDKYKSKELRYSDFEVIKRYCDSKGITFFSTPHDEESLDFLLDLNVPVIKVGSGEVGNWEFIDKIAGSGRPVFLSTGMYTEWQIYRAIGTFYESQLALLHCVTSYPTLPDKSNLNAIRRFDGVISGYSDHTDSNFPCYLAVALGAKVIEKHISLYFDIPDAQDWKVSCDEAGLRELVAGIRGTEILLGTGEIEPLTEQERIETRWARKNPKTGLRPENEDMCHHNNERKLREAEVVN